MAKPVSLLGPATFHFLNETHELTGAGHEGAEGRDPWNDPARDKLWLYNLHYFDDLNAAGREERQPWHLALLQRWVNENPPAQGNGWEPYPTSLRIVNWIKWSLTIAPERGGVAVALPPACLQSLAVQDSSVRATAEPQAARPDRGDQAAHGASSRRQGCRVSAAHDGYRRLPGRPVHRRSWCMTGEGLAVSDVLEGDYAEAVARFHLHPAVRIERDQIAPGDAPDTLPNPVATPHADANPAQRATGTLLLPDGQAVAWRVTGGQARIVANHWHPQFGVSTSSLCLEVSIAGHECRFEL